MGATADTSGAKINISSATKVDEANKADNEDNEDLKIDPTADNEEVSLLSFQIADIETLGIPSNSILRKIHVVIYRKTAGPAAAYPQLCLLNQSFTENQANWYGPEGGSAVLWEPAFDNNSETDVNPGPLKGKPCDSATTTAPGSTTLVIDENIVAEERFTFGSVINCGLWALGGNSAEFEDDSSGSNQPQYYITYEIPTPSPPGISIAANPDGVTGTITIDKDTESEDLQKYSICWSTSTGSGSPKHTDNVTDFTDTGKSTFDTSTLTGSALATEDTSYYFRLYAEDSINTDDNGGASNLIHVRRPKVTLSTSSVIAPTSLAIGQETSLTVIADAVSEAEYGGKFSSVLVNWDAGTSDTDADYSEYFFDQATAPALTTVGNLTMTHKYSSDGSKTIKVRVRDPNGFVSDKGTLATGATVAEANPVARITTSKKKVLSSKFADLNNLLTISANQSRAIGSNKKLQNYLFTCQAGRTDSIVTMGAFDNNNEVFDTSSKKVALRQLDDNNLSSLRIKLYGLASFNASGVPISDADVNFAYYKYTSEKIRAIDGTDADVVFKQGSPIGDAGITGNNSYNYFKSIEAAIVTDVDTDDLNGARHILTVEQTGLTYRLSGVKTAEAPNSSQTMIDVTDVDAFRVGDVIRITNEEMKVLNRDTVNNRLYLLRGYRFTTKASHPDNRDIELVDPWIINKDIRWKSEIATQSYHRRYRWGGFARILGEGSDGIDFLVHSDDGSGTGAGNTIVLQDVVAVSSSQDDLCWFNNGFFEDDIIMVGNTSDNGSYASPKFFKLAGFESSGSGNFDTAYVYGTDVDDYITAGVATDADEDADIVRIVNNPNRSVAIYNPTYDDEVMFEARVIDNDATSFLVNTDVAHTTINMAQPNVLDIITSTDYDAGTSENSLTSSDVAILDISKSRRGGVVAQMPLGSRKYPLAVTRSKVGLPTLMVRLRILSTTGLRKIRSLIEGDTYDYVFIDSNQIDSPGTVDVTYRLKFTEGSLDRNPSMGSEYEANLNFVIVGEGVS